jgi:hypothetical protein
MRYGDAFSRTHLPKHWTAHSACRRGSRCSPVTGLRSSVRVAFLICINVNTIASMHLALGQYVLRDVQ